MTFGGRKIVLMTLTIVLEMSQGTFFEVRSDGTVDILPDSFWKLEGSKDEGGFEALNEQFVPYHMRRVRKLDELDGDSGSFSSSSDETGQRVSFKDMPQNFLASAVSASDAMRERYSNRRAKWRSAFYNATAPVESVEYA